MTLNLTVSTTTGLLDHSWIQYMSKSAFLKYVIVNYVWTYYSPSGEIPTPYQFLFPGTRLTLTGAKKPLEREQHNKLGT